MAKYTLADLGLQFPDDDACLAYLFSKRYGQHGPACPCGKRDSYHRVQGAGSPTLGVVRAADQPDSGDHLRPLPDAAHALVLCHVPDVQQSERRGRAGIETPARSHVQNRVADGSQYPPTDAGRHRPRQVEGGRRGRRDLRRRQTIWREAWTWRSRQNARGGLL